MPSDWLEAPPNQGGPLVEESDVTARVLDVIQCHFFHIQAVGDKSAAADEL